MTSFPNGAHSLRNLAYGGHSMVAKLERVLVHSPQECMGSVDPAEWNYSSKVCVKTAQQQHDSLVNLLRAQNIEVIHHMQDTQLLADAIFVHDPVLITNAGAIILQMGKSLRRGEEALLKATLQNLDIPIFSELTSDATAECGDLLWLNDKTLLAGRGFRTNALGIEQLRNALSTINVEVIDFDLPFYSGSKACLHLQSFISLVDYKTAVVFLPLMPTAMYQLLMDEGFNLIEVPEEEFLGMGTNILALKPRQVLALENCHVTRKLLQEKGIEVLTYRGDELSLKTEGGPTCLTRPLKRAQA